MKAIFYKGGKIVHEKYYNNYWAELQPKYLGKFPTLNEAKKAINKQQITNENISQPR